jgi:hypothetical protein
MLFSPNNTLCDSDPLQGKIMGSCITVRGKHSSLLVGEHLNTFIHEQEDKFYIVDDVKKDFIHPKIKDIAISGCNLTNSSSITKPLGRIQKNFSKLFAKKAYLRWFEDEGID